MKVLITGGAGFVGSHLANHLADSGHEVTAYDNLSHGNVKNLQGNVQFIEADIRALQIKHAVQWADIVFHFAGISSLPECQFFPEECMSNNVTGTLNILNACALYTTPMVFASTSAIYENGTIIPPRLLYGASKLQCELLCNSYHYCYKFPLKILRFFNVYGSGQDILRPNPPFVGYIIKQVLENQILEIYSTDAKRDYIYVKDICKYCEGLLITDFATQPTITNLCSGISLNTIEIIRILEEIIGRRLTLKVQNPKDFWNKYDGIDLFDKFDLELLEREVNKEVSGFQPEIQPTDFMVGLAETYNIYKRIYHGEV